jgi:hypothetical protein
VKFSSPASCGHRNQGLRVVGLCRYQCMSGSRLCAVVVRQRTARAHRLAWATRRLSVSNQVVDELRQGSGWWSRGMLHVTESTMDSSLLPQIIARSRCSQRQNVGDGGRCMTAVSAAAGATSTSPSSTWQPAVRPRPAQMAEGPTAGPGVASVRSTRVVIGLHANLVVLTD